MINTKCDVFFSIIMPVFNREAEIKIAINSILNQTYDKWELIIVDDCSFDNTRKVANEYASFESRIHVISDGIHEGPYFARQKGTLFAKGEYILFIDSDDFYENSLLSSCYEIIYDSDRRVDIVFYGTSFWYKKTKKKYPLLKSHFVEKSTFICDCLNYGQLYTALWNKAFRKELLINGSLDFKHIKEFRFAEDTFVTLKSIISDKCNYIYYLGKHLYNYVRGGTDCITSNIRFNDVMKETFVFNYYYQKLSSNKDLLSSLDYFYIRYYSSIFNYIHLSRKERIKRKEIHNSLRKMNSVEINHDYLTKRKLLKKEKIINCKLDFKILIYIKRFYILLR